MVMLCYRVAAGVTTSTEAVMTNRRPASQQPPRAPGTHSAAQLAELPPTLTVDDAGKMLGISRRSAYRAAANGELPVLRLGRRLLVPTPRLLALLGMPLDAPGAEGASDDTARLVTAGAAGEAPGRARPLPPPMRPRVPR